MFRIIPLLFLAQVIASATTIYVEAIMPVSSPYYNFYLDETKQIPFNFTNSGTDTLVAGQTYTFVGLDIPSNHPFRMYVQADNGDITDLVTFLTTGGSQSFTLNAITDYSSYTKIYRCNAHSWMTGSFNITNPSPEQISSFQTPVSIVSFNGNKYTLNGNTDYVSEYGLGIGTYTFINVPESHPMALSNATNISYVGDVDKKIVDANGKDFYHGDLTVYVYGDFGTASLICLYHGYMGGENMLVYGQEYALTAPSTKTLNIYSSSDLNTWELLQTETVEASENSLFLKATVSE